MSTRPSIEGLLAPAMRSEAEAAMSATDTERELERQVERWEHDSARRRGAVAIAVAAGLVAVLVTGVTVARRDTAGPPADDRDRPALNLSLDGLAGPDVPVTVREVTDGAAPVVLSGLPPGTNHGVAVDADGTAWTLTPAPSGVEFSLRRISADRSTVDLEVRFSGQGVPSGTATDEVVVLAVTRGGPSPDIQSFADRHDGLLRVDKSTGKVLGFTLAQAVSDVDAAPDGTVWAVVSPNEVAQFDPRTGQRLRSLRPPGLVDRVWVLDDLLWVYYQAGEPSRAYLMDPDSGRVVRTVTNSKRSIHVRAAGGIVVFEESGRMVRVEPDGTTRAAQLQLPRAGSLLDLAGFDDEDFWLTMQHRMIRVDGRTLTVEGAARLPWLGPYQVAHDGESVLVPNPIDQTLRRISDSALGPD